jgi:hypothetical protein
MLDDKPLKENISQAKTMSRFNVSPTNQKAVKKFDKFLDYYEGDKSRQKKADANIWVTKRASEHTDYEPHGMLERSYERQRETDLKYQQDRIDRGSINSSQKHDRTAHLKKLAKTNVRFLNQSLDFA